MSLKAVDCCSNRGTGPCRPCVLIVDDEESVRGALMRYFARRGWDVCEAEDGEEARRMLEPNEGVEFDLVICDLRMPRLSGSDLYRWLTHSRPEAAERVVFSSGDIESVESAAFVKETRRPVLSKPFELCQLARVIDEVYRGARAA